MTLTELYDALEKHDWFYGMSDDHSVWMRGQAAEKTLRAQARSIEGGQKLFDDFLAHVTSGEPWGTAKQPKPARPEPSNA
jgi:hypothetical protein